MHDTGSFRRSSPRWLRSKDGKAIHRSPSASYQVTSPAAAHSRIYRSTCSTVTSVLRGNSIDRTTAGSP